jgi:aconitate hydratase
VAAASAVAGSIADPRSFKPVPELAPKQFVVDNTLLIYPEEQAAKTEIIRGPNIKPLKQQQALENTLSGKVLIKLPDAISTDDILPAGPLTQHLRSNLPAISEFVFHYIDKDFATYAKENNGGFIVAGENYGQGSSREHAALAPAELGIKAVLAKSFARIHRANLINNGIVPLIVDTDNLHQGDELEIDVTNFERITLQVNGKDSLEASHDLSDREIAIIKAGGILAYTRGNSMSSR